MNSRSATHQLHRDALDIASANPPASRWWIIGGLLGALAALSCCVVPLALFMLGVSGAWIANLTALAPYQPLFVILTLICLGVGFQRVYGQPQRDCKAGSYCATPTSQRVLKTALWTAVGLVTVALSYPLVVPALLGL